MALVDPNAEVVPPFRFWWREFGGWDVADYVQVQRARQLVREILGPAREALGRLDISRGGWIESRYGYLRDDGHATGGAIDFVPAEASTWDAYVWLRDHARFGELIYETDHVHVTLPGIGGDGETLLLLADGSYAVDPEGSGGGTVGLTLTVDEIARNAALPVLLVAGLLLSSRIRRT